MPRAVPWGIFPLVRLAGYHPLLPLSWTPPHTLGGAFGAAIFFAITGIYGFFLTRDFINYEARPAIVGCQAREPPAASRRESGDACKRQQIQWSGKRPSRRRRDRAGGDGRHPRPDPPGWRTRPQGRRHRRFRSARPNVTRHERQPARHVGQRPARSRLCHGRPDHPRQRRQRDHRGTRTARRLRLPRALGRGTQQRRRHQLRLVRRPAA